ncbi:hypothetical protein B0H63DRAFT_419716, partial [Podospora didyma]
MTIKDRWNRIVTPISPKWPSFNFSPSSSSSASCAGETPTSPAESSGGSSSSSSSGSGSGTSSSKNLVKSPSRLPAKTLSWRSFHNNSN